MTFTSLVMQVVVVEKEIRYKTEKPYYILRVRDKESLYEVVTFDYNGDQVQPGQEILITGYLKGKIEKNESTGKEYPKVSIIGQRIVLEAR